MTMLNWRAASGLHAAIQKEVAAIESQIKELDRILKDSTGHTDEYWMAQIVECREAVDQLKGVAARMNKIKWAEIVRTKGKTSTDAAQRNAEQQDQVN